MQPTNQLQTNTNTNKSPLSKSLQLVEPVCRRILVTRPLSTRRQTHDVTLAAVRTHISEALDIVLHDAARVIFNRHGRQLGRQLKDSLGAKRLEALPREDGVFSHDAVGGLVAEGEEGGEGFLFVSSVS